MEATKSECFRAPWVKVTFMCIATKNSRKGDDQKMTRFKCSQVLVLVESNGNVEVRKATKCSQVLSHPPS